MGCIIVTIGLPDPDQLFIHPYICPLHVLCPGPRLKKTFALLKATLNRVRLSFQFEAQDESHHFYADEILARHRITLPSAREAGARALGGCRKAHKTLNLAVLCA